jgi:hypothetical protein
MFYLCWSSYFFSNIERIPTVVFFRFQGISLKSNLIPPKFHNQMQTVWIHLWRKFPINSWNCVHFLVHLWPVLWDFLVHLFTKSGLIRMPYLKNISFKFKSLGYAKVAQKDHINCPFLPNLVNQPQCFSAVHDKLI